MKSKERSPSYNLRKLLLIAVSLWMTAGLSMTGCNRRRPGLPPPLMAPWVLKELSSIRAGNQIVLNWTIPQKTMDKLIAKGFTTIHICRRESTTGPCIAAAETIKLAAGSIVSFSEMLPSDLTSGSPRVLTYSLELTDREGRSNGMSYDVATIAGAPPPYLNGLTADLQSDGVLLRWPPSVSQEPAGTIVRLYRRQIGTSAEGTEKGHLSSSDRERQKPALEADANEGQARDKEVRMGKTYEYVGQRVVHVKVGDRIWI